MAIAMPTPAMAIDGFMIRALRAFASLLACWQRLPHSPPNPPLGTSMLKP